MHASRVTESGHCCACTSRYRSGDADELMEIISIFLEINGDAVRDLQNKSHGNDGQLAWSVEGHGGRGKRASMAGREEGAATCEGQSGAGAARWLTVCRAMAMVG